MAQLNDDGPETPREVSLQDPNDGTLILGVRLGVWKASLAASVLLGLLLLLWTRVGRHTPPEPQALRFAGERVDGVYEVLTVEAGCEGDAGDLAEMPFFVLRYGPGASAVLHGCADETSCADVQRRDRLGVGPVPVPIPAHPQTCCTGEVAEARPIEWRDAVVFPTLLLAEADGSALTDDRHRFLFAGDRCVGLRYRASFARGEGDEWIVERRVDHAVRDGCNPDLIGLDALPEDAPAPRSAGDAWAATLDACAERRRYTARLRRR